MLKCEWKSNELLKRSEADRAEERTQHTNTHIIINQNKKKKSLPNQKQFAIYWRNTEFIKKWIILFFPPPQTHPRSLKKRDQNKPNLIRNIYLLMISHFENLNVEKEEGGIKRDENNAKQMCSFLCNSTKTRRSTCVCDNQQFSYFFIISFDSFRFDDTKKKKMLPSSLSHPFSVVNK